MTNIRRALLIGLSDVNKATTPKAKAKAKANATYLKGQKHNHVSTAFIPDS